MATGALVEQARRIRDTCDHAVHDLVAAEPFRPRPVQNPQHLYCVGVTLNGLSASASSCSRRPRATEAQVGFLGKARERPRLLDFGLKVIRHEVNSTACTAGSGGTAPARQSPSLCEPMAHIRVCGDHELEDVDAVAWSAHGPFRPPLPRQWAIHLAASARACT